MSAASNNMQIHAPELLTERERRRDSMFTALMWGVYLYLWIPLASLFAWLLGFEFAYDLMIRMGGVHDLGGILTFYAVVITAIFFIVTAWSLGNRLRYGHLTRRRAPKDISDQEMADYFNVEDHALNRLRSAQSVTIDFDAIGRPVIEHHEVVPGVQRRERRHHQ